MSKDPAFLFYPGDYLRDTQTLSEKSQVSYDRIMCEHMRNICISESRLKFFTKRLNPDELDELMNVLTAVPGGYCIDWVVLSIEKRKAYSKSRSENRKGNPKEDMSNISKTYVPHMENENEIEIENKSGVETKDNPLFLEAAIHLKKRILETRQQIIKESHLKAWVNSVRLMVEQDHRTLDDIHALIDECHNMEPTPSGFTWRSNILSMGKLREKWNEGKIFIGMTSGQKTGQKYGRQELSTKAIEEVHLERRVI